MHWQILLFCAGILTALLIPGYLPLLGACAGIAVMLGLRVGTAFMVRSGGWLLAGMAIASAHFALFDGQRVSRPHTRLQTGCIVSPIQSAMGVSKFAFKTVGGGHGWWADRYRLSWYGAPPQARPGTCWQLVMVLKPPRGSLNEIGMDYERWLYSRAFTGVGTVKNLPLNKPVTVRSLTATMMAWRMSLHRRLQALLSGHASAPLLSALAVGIRADLDDAHWRVLRYTGTAHLMAISGLHIGLAAVLGFAGGRYFPWPLHNRTNLVDRGRLWALVFATAYAALAGFAISTIRALIMLALWSFFARARHATGAWTTLVIALAIILAFDPFSAAGGGLWLSAGAVAAIVSATYGVSAKRTVAARCTKALRLQLALTLLLLPLSVPVAGGISWIAAPVNLLLIPLFTVAIVPGVLLGMLVWWCAPELAHMLLTSTATLLDIVWQGLGQLASYSYAFTELRGAAVGQSLLVLVAGFVLLMPRLWPARSLGALLLLPVFFARSPALAAGQMHIDILDVGQALAVVMQIPGYTLVYDTGNAWPGNDSGRSLLVPLLRHRGVGKIDDLIISHADRDHAGGAVSVQRAVTVERVLVGEDVPGITNAQYCQRGLSWSHNNVRIEILHPHYVGQAAGNDQSCVVLIVTPGGRILLTGDLGARYERRLLQHPGVAGVDLVIGGHHGSLSSSDPLFVRTTRARFVVFSNGYANQWGMPREQVVARWQTQQTTVLETAQSGQIQFRVDRAQGLYLHSTARMRASGRWRWRAN